MTFRPPLSSQSEVVNTNRRWNQDWYTWLSDLATAVGSGGGGGGSSSVIISDIEPASPIVGQIWLNPVTGLVSVAEVPSYAWSDNLSAGSVVLSGSDLVAVRHDATYPNIGSPSTAGARSKDLLPTTQKHLFGIVSNVDLGGNSGFGICDQRQTMGNGMFLGSPTPNPSPGIGYYVQSFGFYYFVDNASPLSGSSPIENGVHWVAIDPVAKKMWVKPVGGNWNDNALNNPTTGVGGVAFTFDVTQSRIVAQFGSEGDGATIDAAATGLGVVSGFTPLSEIVRWIPLTSSAVVNADWVNIKDDFGAVGDGVAEDGPSFQAFTKAYQGQEVALYIPPGIYQSGSTTLGLWRGITKLTIYGYGATLGAGLNSFGALPDLYGVANSALIQSAIGGPAQVALVNIGDASKFADGDWIMVGALDVQGAGIPPNPHFMEFVQITSVSGVDIFLDHFLKTDPYLSTYPYYNDNASGVNEGGPATIWNMTQMFPWWDADYFVHGVTFLDGNDVGNVRNLIYRDCQWPGLQSNNWPRSISQSKSITFENSLIQGGGSIEVDKCVELLTFRNCDITGYYSFLLFQSSSIQHLVIDSSILSGLSGTPRKTYINNSVILDTLIPGPRSNGIMESLFIENSYVGAISDIGWGASFDNADAITNFTFSNGTFSKPNTGSAIFVPWACPGSRAVFQNATGFRSPPFFTVLDVRSDAPGVPATGNILIDTTLDSLPTWTQGTASANPVPSIMTFHPYGKVTVRNCRGDHRLMNWQDSANPYRYDGSGFQYTSGLLTGNRLVTSRKMHAEGYIQAININVLRAYAGANGTEYLNWTGFETYPGGTFAGAVTPTLAVDVKTAGLRSWANGAWVGAAGGDTLPAITALTWLWDYTEFSFDNDMSGDALAKTPIVAVEIITDVGIIKYQWIEYGSVIVRS